MSSPLSGVTIDLSGLGSYIGDGIRVYLPLFLIAAGLVVGALVLTRGLGFLRGATGRR